MNARKARSSIGTPRIGRNCFGSPGPARTPAPAATTTTPTSGCEATGELTNALQPNHFEVSAGLRSVREEHPPKTLPRGFGEAALDARDGPDLAAKSHFAQEERVGRHGPVVDRRDQGGEDGEVGGRLDQAHTSCDVHKDVEVPE